MNSVVNGGDPDVGCSLVRKGTPDRTVVNFAFVAVVIAADKVAGVPYWSALPDTGSGSVFNSQPFCRKRIFAVFVLADFPKLVMRFQRSIRLGIESYHCNPRAAPSRAKSIIDTLARDVFFEDIIVALSMRGLRTIDKPAVLHSIRNRWPNRERKEERRRA